MGWDDFMVIDGCGRSKSPSDESKPTVGRKMHSLTLQVLIDGQANLEQRMHGGDTPLHQAAWQGHLPMLQLLTDRGASVFALKDDGDTALALSAFRGHLEPSRELLRRMMAGNDRADASFWNRMRNYHGRFGCNWAMEEIQLKDYQTSCLEKAKHQNVLLVLPPQMGKTFIACQLAEWYRGQDQLVVYTAPSVELCHQAAGRFRQQPQAAVATVTG
eukprot:s5677_g1.t1